VIVASCIGICLSCSSGQRAHELPINTDSPNPFRLASDSEIQVAGNDFIAQHGANNRPGVNPDSHIIAPGGDDDLAWAQYCLEDFDVERPLSSAVEVATVIAPGGDDDLPLLYWLGAYNYTQDHWDWFGPFDEADSVILNSEECNERYVSAANELNLTILTDCSGIEPTVSNPEGITAVEIILSKTTASGSYVFTKPHYVEITGISLGDKGASALDPDTQYVTITWNHIYDTSDPKNEASKYKAWRNLLDDPYSEDMMLGDVDAPQEHFVDPTDNSGEGKYATPGATYMYYIQAFNQATGAGPKVPAGSVTIPFYPPTDVNASDTEYDDRIVLTWTKAEGADEYYIYRDSQESIPEIVGDVDTWIDANVTSGEEHVYWIKSKNEYAISEFSLSDTGSTS
jgi:hypothetical protein